MERKILLILLLTAFHITDIVAQEKFIREYKVSIFSGIRDTKIDSFPNSQHVDFMNYLYDFHTGYDYEYIGLKGHFWFKNNWEADMKVAMYDDFSPDNLNITVQYLPIKNLGVSLGLYTHSQLMNGFTTFHKTSGIGLYGDLETNFRQRKLFDRGIMCGIVLTKEFGFFHPTLKLNCGISSFKPFSEIVLQKEINGNFLRRIDYQTENTWNFFFLPELSLDLDCIKINKVKLGFQLHANLFYAEKAIGYMQTTYEWTTENAAVQRVNSAVHTYRKYDIDLGIYLKW